MSATVPLNQHNSPLWLKTGCLSLLILFLAAWQPTSATAQITLYNYTNASDGSATTPMGLSGTNLTLGDAPLSGGDCPGPNQGFGSDGWPVTNTFDVDVFNTNKDYVTFTLTPTGMNSLLITGFTGNSRRENQTGTADDGPASLRYAYSKTTLAGSWTSVNPGNPQASNNCNSLGVQRIWNSFPAVTVNAGESITFRIYGLSSGSNLTGDLYLRNVQVTGYICAGTPTVTLGANPTVCDDAATATLSVLSSSSDITSYSIDFVSPSIPDIGPVATTPGSFPSSINNIDVSGAGPGTYPATMTVSSICGGTGTANFSVIVDPLPNATISVVPSEICAGRQITLTFTESNYAPGTEFTISGSYTDDQGTHNMSYTDVVSTDYLEWTEGVDFFGDLTIGTVTVVNETNGCTSTATGLSVLVNPLPDVSVSIAPSAICPGETVKLTFTDNANNGHTYSITAILSDDNGNYPISYTGVSTGDMDTYTEGIDFNGDNYGTVSLTSIIVTDETTGCSIELSDIYLTVYPTPTVDAVSNQTVCHGSSTSLIDFNGNLGDGATYNWTNDQPSIGLAASGNGDIPSFTATNTGAADVTATIVVTPTANGCTGSSQTFTITVHPNPVLSFTAQVIGDPAQSGSSTGPTTVTLDFCDGDFFSFTAFATNNPQVGFLEDLTGSGNITYNAVPVIVPRPQNDFGPGELAGYFNIGGLPYGPYGLSMGTSGNFNQTYTPYLDVNNDGDYDAGTDCLGTPVTLVYNVYAYPVPAIAVTETSGTADDAIICLGASATLTASGGTSYSWSTGATTAAITDSPTSTTTYTVTVTSNGCSTSTSMVITVYPMPSLSATIDGVTVINNNDGQDDTGAFALCNGGTNNVTISAFSDLTNSAGNIKAYQTIVANNVSAPFCNNCAALVTLFAGATGTVALVNPNLPGTLVMSFRIFNDVNDNNIIDPEECPNDWVVYTITVNPIPTPVISVTENSGTTSNDGSICIGSSVTLTASGGTSYSWDNGATTASITVSPASTTTYTVTVTANNCSSSTSQVITVNPLPTVTLDLTDDQACITETPFPLGGGYPGPGTYSGAGISGSPNFDAAAAGVGPHVITYSFTDGNGCSSSATDNITVYDLHIVSYQPATLIRTICDGDNTFFRVNFSTSPVSPVTATWEVNDGGGWDPVVAGPLYNTTPANPTNFTRLNITGATYALNGYQYRVTLSDGVCSVTSDPFLLEVYGPITFLDQPESVTICGPGAPQTAVFTADVDNPSGPLNLRWQYFNTGTMSWQNIPNIFGASTEVLTLTNAWGNWPAPGGSVQIRLRAWNSACADVFSDVVTLTIHYAITPSISGPTVVHAGAQSYLFGTPGITLPGTLAGETWLSSDNLIASVDNTGLVTGVTPGGPVTITYQVTDNAGCTGTATYQVTVLPAVKLTAVPSAASTTCGEIFTVDITADNFADLIDLQYSLSWNPAQLKYLPSYSALAIGGDAPLVNDLLAVSNGQLEYSWYSSFAPQTLPNGTVVLSLTFQVTTNSGSASISITGSPTPIHADNSSFQEVPVMTMDGSVDINPIAIVLGNPSAICPVPCPGNSMVTFPILASTGSPNVYSIDWDDPGFFDINTAVLDLIEGELIVVVPCGLTHGTYSGQLIVTNTTTGCSSVNYTITVTVDETPPVASIDPEEVYLDCIDDIPNALDAIDDITASDDCEPLSITFCDESNNEGSGCFDDELIIWRLYCVTDAAGNTAYVTQTIHVEDDIRPDVDDSEYEVSCFDTESEAIDAVLTYAEAHKSDNCSEGAEIVIESILLQPITYDEFSCHAFVNFTATDACGNEESFSYEVIIDGQAPEAEAGIIDDCYEEASGNEPLQNAYDAAIAATQASDNCTDAEDLEFSAVAVDPNNRCNLTIIVTVKDECGHSTQVTYNTRVDGTDPYLVDPNPLALSGNCYTNEEDALAEAISITQALDNCPGPIQYDGYVDPMATCPYTLVVTATDFCGNFTTILYENVYIDADAPEVVDQTPEQTCFHSSQEAIDYALSITTWSDNCTDVEDLIVDASYAASTNQDDPCEMGVVTISVTDHCGLTGTVSYDVTIDDTPPTADPLGDLTIYCFADLELMEVTINATDNCGGQVTVTGYEDGPLDEDCTFRRTYYLEDACGNQGYVLQNIIINDTEAPVWDDADNTETLYAACDDSHALSDAMLANPPAVDDNCEVVLTVPTVGDPVYSQECDYNYTITMTWTAYDQCGNSSTFTRIIEVSDEQAPTFEPGCQFMPLNLYSTNENDYTLDCPAEATISLEEGQVIDNATTWTVGGVSIPALGSCISDNCSEASEIDVTVMSIVYDDEDLPCRRTITVSFQLSDACGNIQEEPFVCIYNLYDNTAPDFVDQPSLNRQISCSDELALLAAQSLSPEVIDNCDPDAYAIKTEGEFVQGDCEGSGTFTNTWVAVDACGNQSETVFTQVITLIDDEPPTFAPGCQFMPLVIKTSQGENVQCPEDATTSLEEGQIIDVFTSWTVAGVTIPSMNGCVFDNCSSPGSILVSVENISSVYNPDDCSRTITISFRLTDDCGNEQPELFVCVYVIMDDIAPFVSQGSIGSCYHTVAEAQAAALAATSYSDNCTDFEDLEISASTDGTCSAVVTVTVTDCAGNSTQVFYNTRIDNTPPNVFAGTIASSYPSIAAAQAAAQAATTATDNCPGSLTMSSTVVGTCQAIITVTVTDGCGNSSSVSYTTSIVQNPLAVSCPGNATRNADANCTYTVVSTEFDPSITGGCGISNVKYQLGANTPVTANTLAGVVLPKGATTITWIVTDINNNTATCSFTVTVNDTQTPSIACPANIVKNNDANACGAVTTYTVTASDNCMFTVTQTGGLASGALFPVGTTTNSFMVVDMSGNSTACQFTVTVNDTQAPTIVCPGNASRTTTMNACTYTVIGTEFNPTVSDNCGTSTTSYTLGGASSGSGSSSLAGVVLNKGTTTILWTVTDIHGNTAGCSFSVVVTDGQAPTITCPSNITVNADGGGCTAVVNNLGVPSTSDNCPGTITVTNTGVPLNNVYSGVTTIVWKATDAAGNTSTCTQTVSVLDAQNPTVNCPVSGTVTRATNVNDCFYTVSGAEFNATGSDNCGMPTITYSLSGATTGTGTSLTGVNLNKGLTTITWKATDAGGNMVTCSFNVQVNDTRPPVIACPPNIEVNAPADACSAVVTPGVLGASDNCGTPTTTFGPIPMGSIFPVGTTILTGTASDNSGNTAMCTMTVKVKDVTAPVFFKCPSNVTLTATEGNCAGVYGSNDVPVVTESCAYSLSWVLSGATTGSGSGTIPPSQVFQTGVTTVTYTATDASGNTTVCTFTVSVNCIKVAGKIIWEHNRVTDPKPVKNATVRLTSSAMPPVPASPLMTMTDNSGMYMFTIPAGKDLRITPTKPALNNAQKLDGVTIEDAQAIQAHVAGTLPITDPYKQVAADVNHTNTITTVDASIITSALMGNPLALAAFDTSWRFLRADLMLTLPPWPLLPNNNRIVIPGTVTTDQLNKDFIGIKIGNVNGTPAPVFAPSSPLIWLVQDQQLQANQELTAVFTAAQFSELTAYQFALDFDPTQLQLIDIQPLGPLSLNATDNFGTFNAAEGEIRAAWSNASGINLTAGTPVFKVRFKALTGGAKLSELLQLNDEVLPGMAFNAEHAESEVVLSFSELSTSVSIEPLEGRAQLLQNRPNPFNEETTIGFILPEACEAQLRVYDLSGREITSYRRQYSAGYHEIVFRVNNASDYGVMFYELTTPSGRLVRKMISTGK